MVRKILLTKNMMEGSHLYDIYLKVVGLVVIYLLAMYELIVQYIWLFRYRTGLLAGPNEKAYSQHKTVLITGALGTIGREVAKKALEYNNRVLILDILPKEEASKIFSKLGDPEKVTYYQVDLCNLEDLKSVCSQIVNDKLVPDVLLFNAGIMHAPRKLFGGVESQLLVSYISHCLILSELHEYLKPSARVVFVSSVCHKPGFVQLDDLQGRHAYSSHLWYTQAKMCQLLLVAYLANNTQLHVNAVHPGIVDSSLYKHVALRNILKPFYSMTPAEAALCPTFACLSDDIKGVRGKYFAFCRPATPNKLMYDTEFQKKLFEKTVAMLESYTDFAKIVPIK